MATYYVSQSGSDSNNGLSTGAPWQTLAHVAAQSFGPDDQILLHAGDTWREAWTIPSGGTAGHPILTLSQMAGATG